MPEACEYGVIAFATWPEQHTHLMASIMAQKCPGQKFLLLVHNPDLLLHPLPGETATQLMSRTWALLSAFCGLSLEQVSAWAMPSEADMQGYTAVT